MFGLSSVPALLQGLGMLLLPSSPRWLVSVQKNREVCIIVLTLMYDILLENSLTLRTCIESK